MSEMKHTLEPWKLIESGHGELDIEADHGYAVVSTTLEGDENSKLLIRQNMRRIVACVNACKRYLNDELEYGMVEKEREANMAWERAMMAAIGEDGIKSVSEAIGRLKGDYSRAVFAGKEMEKQRDDLLFAAERAYETMIQERNNVPLKSRPYSTEQTIETLRAAIAKARGTA